jgi:hypothetical protein
VSNHVQTDIGVMMVIGLVKLVPMNVKNVLVHPKPIVMNVMLVNISIITNVSTHVHTDIMKMTQLILKFVLLVTMIVVIVLEVNITNVSNVVELEVSTKENVEKNAQKDGT